ncbi:MAG: phosphoglycerate kinase [Candidatus Pacebacteria bacterium]|nr:phosphoglycerate kinase [Candidatus Paceibacterota bacterium]
MKNLKEINVDNKKVLVRVDFNVPLTSELEVSDTFRIEAHLETIKYLKDNNAKIILISHLGNPKGREVGLSLKPVAKKLEEISSFKVNFVEDTLGDKVNSAINEMEAGDILLLENVRFYKEEEENNSEFAASLARLGDIFVQDAFSVCHRDHASVSQISSFIESYAGLLLEKEVRVLDSVNEGVKRPFVAVIGGAKILNKTSVIENFLDKADVILLGGMVANTVLNFKEIYGEIKDKEVFEAIKNIDFESPKVIVPIDGIISRENFSRVGGVETIKEGEDIVDIGPETIEYYKAIIKKAKTVVWNGPMGKIESEISAKGTEAIARIISSQNNYSVVGGGETVDFINSKNMRKEFSFISSGGGAMLDYISGKKLPGIEALNKHYER